MTQETHSQGTHPQGTHAPGTHAQWTYAVTGMTCAHCVRAVTAEVGAIPGVRSVVVDLERGEVGVTAAKEPTLEAVRAAVEEAGYELVGLAS